MNRQRLVLLLLLVLVAGLLEGCVSTGPKTIPGARHDYNEAVTRSFKEQLLLNLVRLRYGDTPLFLEVSSVVAQYDFAYGAAAALSPVEDQAGGLGVEGSYGVTESPVVTYVPLEGESFVKRLLTPASPGTLLRLSQSGWSIERILLCCVHSVGPLRNAPSAAGPTPSKAPEYRDFHALAAALRELQQWGLLEAELERKRLSPSEKAPSEKAPSEKATGEEKAEELVLRLALRPDWPRCKTIDDCPARDAVLSEDRVRKARAEVAELLNLPRDWQAILLLDEKSNLQHEDGVHEVPVASRSLLATLFYLAQAVEIPEGHRETGWAVRTFDEDGELFDWSELTGKLLRIGTSPERPENAYAAVRYQGEWFYIDRAWTTSKSTFILLTYLFSLQDTGESGQGPLLTIGG